MPGDPAQGSLPVWEGVWGWCKGDLDTWVSSLL